MSTSATVFIREYGAVVACIYKHWDGYPAGIGRAIQDFAGDIPVTRGLNRQRASFNGMDDFAAALVAHLKTDPETKKIIAGDVYLYPADTVPFASGEDYVYTLTAPGDDMEKDRHIWVDVRSDDQDEPILSGYLAALTFDRY